MQGREVVAVAYGSFVTRKRDHWAMTGEKTKEFILAHLLCIYYAVDGIINKLRIFCALYVP